MAKKNKKKPVNLGLGILQYEEGKDENGKEILFLSTVDPGAKERIEGEENYQKYKKTGKLPPMPNKKR